MNQNTFLAQKFGGMPFIAATYPDHYIEIPKLIRHAITNVQEHFISIKHPEQTVRFIKGVCEQKIIKSDIVLNYGIWVSISKNNLEVYLANKKNQNFTNIFIGYICNNLPWYESMYSIKVKILVDQTRFKLPILIPFPDDKHEFIEDYYMGINLEKATERIEQIIQHKK